MSKKMNLFDDYSDTEISFAEMEQEMTDQIREESINKNEEESDFEMPDFVARD